MFVFLSKFLPPFVYPLGLACILLIGALILRKRQRWQTSLIIIALVVLFLGGNRFVSMALSRSLEWQYLPKGDLPKTDVIVVLGGGTDAPEAPRPEVDLTTAGERVIYGAELFQQGKAPHVLLSGGTINWMADSASTPASEMNRIITLMGVPQSAIWLQPRSQNTYEDALFSGEMLKQKGIQRIILVTSAMHMPRSVALFRKQGFDVIPAPTDFRVTQAGWQALFAPDILDQVVALMPTTSNLNNTSNVLKEYLGLLVYRLRGWI